VPDALPETTTEPPEPTINVTAVFHACVIGVVVDTFTSVVVQLPGPIGIAVAFGKNVYGLIITTYWLCGYPGTDTVTTVSYVLLASGFITILIQNSLQDEFRHMRPVILLMFTYDIGTELNMEHRNMHSNIPPIPTQG
jgi:hypothetical protein